MNLIGLGWDWFALSDIKHGPFGPCGLPTFTEPSNQSNGMIPHPHPRRAWGLGEGKISNLRVNVMAWTSPVFEEVVLCCEINSYVSAKL
jgi:hypothetical protein